MRAWLRNVYLAASTIAAGMYVTLWYFVQSYRRGTFAGHFAYPEQPLAVAWGQATLNPTAVQESKRVSLPVWTKSSVSASAGASEEKKAPAPGASEEKK